ncbi:MAG: DUF3341 domain-containing protein [Deltaproteobacteria bacterium]
MTREILVAGFTDESQIRRAAAVIQARNWTVADIYAPYALHSVEELLGQRRSRLPVACFAGGAAGLVLAFWLQFWTSTQSWPLNVGGRPWNSLPAFVPVAFESMVLLAGFSVVGALLVRCGLYPGRRKFLPAEGITDDRFAMIVSAPATAAEVQQALREFQVECRETTGEGPRS